MTARSSGLIFGPFLPANSSAHYVRAYWRSAAPHPRFRLPRGPWLFANREATGPLGALMQTAAESLQALAADPHYLGGTVGLLPAACVAARLSQSALWWLLASARVRDADAVATAAGPRADGRSCACGAGASAAEAAHAGVRAVRARARLSHAPPCPHARCVSDGPASMIVPDPRRRVPTHGPSPRTARPDAPTRRARSGVRASHTGRWSGARPRAPVAHHVDPGRQPPQCSAAPHGGKRARRTNSLARPPRFSSTEVWRRLRDAKPLFC